jgi:hypothetical protein
MAQTVVPPAIQPAVQAGAPHPPKKKKRHGHKPMPKNVPQAGPKSPGLMGYKR